MENKVILIVEDERPLQEAIRAKLESSGFDTVTARDVEQALSYLQDLNQVDAIWLDHYLVGRDDGLVLVEKLKKEGGEWSKIPVFLVTNTAGPDKLRTYLRLGVKKFYIKSDHRLDEIVGEIRKSLVETEE